MTGGEHEVRGSRRPSDHRQAVRRARTQPGPDVEDGTAVVAEHTRRGAPHRLDAGCPRAIVETGDVERAGDPQPLGERRQR